MSDSHHRYQTAVSAIIAALEKNLEVVIQAAKDAHFAATHDQSVAETKYDTFGLESSYLAQGQQKRVDEVNQALAYFLQIPVNKRQIPVEVKPPCVVIIENEHFTRQFFVAPFAGGLSVDIAVQDNIEQTLIVVTPASPVGQSLLTKRLDDEVSVTVKGRLYDFDVVDIY